MSFSVSCDNSEVTRIVGDESLSTNNIEVSDGTVYAQEEHKPLVSSGTGCVERRTQLESQVVVLLELSEVSRDHSELQRSAKASAEAVLLLRGQALESGSAIILEDAPLNADIFYARAVAFPQSAPPEPVFRLRPREIAIRKSEKKDAGDSEVKEIVLVPEVRTSETKTPRNKIKRTKEELPIEVTKGSLRVDELAKLLA